MDSQDSRYPRAKTAIELKRELCAKAEQKKTLLNIVGPETCVLATAPLAHQPRASRLTWLEGPLRGRVARRRGQLMT